MLTQPLSYLKIQCDTLCKKPMSTRILKLTLHRQAFEVMVTGEKNEEYRPISAWIESRLYETNLLNQRVERIYDFVEFTNGYGNDKPRFIAKFLGVDLRPWVYIRYSNGLLVNTKKVYAILLGEIVGIQNYTAPPNE